MTTQLKNEQKFDSWEDLTDGGRRYVYEVKGRFGWKALYIKEVDSNEETIKFYQEIYDDQNKLVETHVKFPIDTGHVKMR
jgi:hypothetical protein